MKNKTTPDKTQLNKKAFLKAFVETFGNVSKTAEAVGIDRRTYYNWLKIDSDFSQEVKAIEPEELFLDFAESQLLKKMREGDITAIIFFLKTKGQRRGYTEKQHIVQEEKKGLTIVVESEELKRKIENNI